jgi:HEPN domain-containing protein
MNGLEAEKPQRLLDNALAFYEAGRRCNASGKASIPPYKEGVWLGAPTVVCHAFAIELFLKLLLLLETGSYPDREHELDTLFDRLSPEVKDRINGNFRDWRGARHYLEEARNAFREWRYPHEHEFLSASHEELAEIGVALRATVSELRPDLVSVFEA